MPRWLVGGVLVLLLSVGAGCSPKGELARLQAENAALRAELQAEQDRARQLEETVDALIGPRPLWTVDAAVHQPRMVALELHARDNELGYAPGATIWRELERPLPPRFTEPGSGFATAADLLAAIVSDLRALGWLGYDVFEVTLRLVPTAEHEAVAVILQWGLMDDSVAGLDLRLDLAAAERGWLVSAAQQREHCARGVTDGGTLCL